MSYCAVEEQVVVLTSRRRIAERSAPAALKPGAAVHAGAVGVFWLPSCTVKRSQPLSPPSGTPKLAEPCHCRPSPAEYWPPVSLDVAALGALFQDDVDHAGDARPNRIGPSAVAQHLDVVDGRHRDRVEVDAPANRGRCVPLALTSAPGCQRLPFTSTSTWSGDRPRSWNGPLERERVRGRRKREIQRRDGARQRLGQVDGAGLLQHVGEITSIGVSDELSVRLPARVPVTTTGPRFFTLVGVAAGVWAAGSPEACRIRVLRRRGVGERKQYGSSQQGRSDPAGTLVHDISPKCVAAMSPWIKATAWLCPSTNVRLHIISKPPSMTRHGGALRSDSHMLAVRSGRTFAHPRSPIRG